MLDREIGGGNFKADIYVGYSVEGPPAPPFVTEISRRQP
jgi:hypothetical protein